MDYASNSHKSKKRDNVGPDTTTEKRVVKQVAEGSRKKKSFGRKLADAFIQDDVQNVKSYIVDDVVIPGIKRAVLDTICNSVSMLLYGESRGGYYDDRPRRSHRSYSSMYEPRERRERRTQIVDEPRKLYSDLDATDEIEYKTKGAADDVIDELNQIIDRYGLAKVADFYETSNLSCDHICNNYGWSNIDDAVVRIKPNGKWMILMPKSMPIEDM